MFYKNQKDQKDPMKNKMEIKNKENVPDKKENGNSKCVRKNRSIFQEKEHEEAEAIFRVLFPSFGLNVRQEQIRLCHEMLDALLYGEIVLCDAGVGIGKTYAYLVACVLLRKYHMAMGSAFFYNSHPVVISTSSIALQKAIVEEYIPFLSKVLLSGKVITQPLSFVVRKGKEHFVCDSRLEERIRAVAGKAKNPTQREALYLLRRQFDLDEATNLSHFDRRLVCVPKFCPRSCDRRDSCRYQNYLKRAREGSIFIQICNHNYLLADCAHREKGYRPLLADYQALVVDEAHKLPEAASQMYGRTLGYEDIQEIICCLEKEHCRWEARKLKGVFRHLFEVLEEHHGQEKDVQKEASRKAGLFLSTECYQAMGEGQSLLHYLNSRLSSTLPGWVKSRLEEAEGMLSAVLSQDADFVFFLRQDRQHRPVLCAASREVPQMLRNALWSQKVPAILTSGTLKAGKGFERTRQTTGLTEIGNVWECEAQSPFQYEKNCLLHFPKTLKKVRHGSQEEAKMLAEHIHALICSTYGHTLVLFTSYALMGSVYQLLKDRLPFPLVEVWRHSQEEIQRFKTLDNAVLFAAGSCWEGVDFPGDMVSSLIIVKLPFAVPDPISEAEKKEYESLDSYIQTIIIPDMQKKLRQGFGRAIRTEQDTCVVSILDYRAVPGGRYHEEVLCALPDCRRAESIEEVEAFIRNKKGMHYYM